MTEKNSFWFVGIGFLLILVVVLAGLEVKKVYGTRNAEIEHEIFINSTAHINGMLDDLASYKHEYDMADSVIEKNVVKATIRERFGDFDEDKITSEGLRTFLINARGY